MEKYEELETLATKYRIPIEDVLLIALNRYGVKMQTGDNRVRFRLKLNSLDEDFYLAVGVNTCEDTGFEIKDGRLFLEGLSIGKILTLEKDSCDSTYFRKNKTEITLNSNSRSQCAGCTFCGTYNLDPNDLSDLTVESSLKNYISLFLAKNNMQDLSNVDGITVCTGCFSTENQVVEHLKLLKRTLAMFKFNQKLKYIGSQIRSDEALNEIKKEIENFGLFVTTEKFTEREKIMRQEKASLDMKKTTDLIDRATKLGFDTTILYILGLESLSDFEVNMKLIAEHVNKYPLVQIFQNYQIEHENSRVSEAKGVEYYLQARKILENIFDNDGFRPESWENYRGLSYTYHRGKPHHSIRV